MVGHNEAFIWFSLTADLNLSHTYISGQEKYNNEGIS